MGKYEIPKCDCGQDLWLYEVEIYEVRTAITQRGEPSKRNMIESATGAAGEPPKLFCSRCKMEYKVGIDGKGRIICGGRLSRDKQ